MGACHDQTADNDGIGGVRVVEGCHGAVASHRTVASWNGEGHGDVLPERPQAAHGLNHHSVGPRIIGSYDGFGYHVTPYSSWLVADGS